MPRLKRHLNGSGTYIRSYLPGVGHVTHQLLDAGHRYLAARGIAADGDYISLAELRRLQTLKCLSTNGTGTGQEPGERPGPEWVAGLSTALVEWAATGTAERLGSILAAGDHRAHCFPKAFLTWLGRLDAGTGLAGLSDVSLAEFESLAHRRWAELEGGPLLAYLMTGGAEVVVWRLARVVGCVAAAGPAPAAAAWAPLFTWLASRVGPPDDPGAADLPDRMAWRRPRVVWRIHDQDVVAQLPPQRWPAGVRVARLRAASGNEVAGNGVSLEVRRDKAGRWRSSEATSGAMESADVFTVEVKTSEPRNDVARWSFDVPGHAPLVLFHSDGTLVDSADPDPLPPGGYYALVRPNRGDEARRLPGTSFCEQVHAEPVGWTRWEGWKIALVPGAEIPGYRVADVPASRRWELAPPPDGGIGWSDPRTVYAGRMPTIRLDPAEAFRGLILDVFSEAGGLSTHRTIGVDVPLGSSRGQGIVDLEADHGLRAVHGRVTIRCRLATQPGSVVPPLRFTRLPDLGWEYVPDPKAPDRATALRINAKPHEFEPLPGTELVPDGPAVVLRACEPVHAPGVAARHRQGGWDVRVRVAASRAMLLHGDAALGGWQRLPVPGIDLTRITLNDRLKVEFCEPPVLDQGRLACRQPGGRILLEGEPTDRSDRPRTFLVALHRWRDVFDSLADGRVQVRGRAGWIDVARLVGPSAEPPPRSLPPSPTWWQERIERMEQAAANGDAAAAALAARSFDRTQDGAASAAAADLLPVTAAGVVLLLGLEHLRPAAAAALAPLAARADLAEAASLAALLDVRAGRGPWDVRRIEAVRDRLPEGPGAGAVLAECWYRYARSVAGPADGCWQSVRTESNRYIRFSEGRAGPESASALLLRDLAYLMLNEWPPILASTHALPPAYRDWAMAVGRARRFLGTEWRRASRPPEVVELSQPPDWLHPDDVAWLRLAVRLDSNGDVSSEDRAAVGALPADRFWGLELIRARSARYTGDAAAAEESYGKAHRAAVLAGRLSLVELIGRERM